MPEEEKTEEELELETLEVENDVVEFIGVGGAFEPTPEWIASHQRTHDIKVAKFLAGGEY